MGRGGRVAALPSPRGDGRRRDRGGRGELGAGVGRVCTAGCAAGLFRPPLPRRLPGCPGRVGRPGSAAGDTPEAPICPGQPLPRGDCRVSMALGKRGLWAF